jgi:Flp pilus assembly protein TadD
MRGTTTAVSIALVAAVFAVFGRTVRFDLLNFDDRASISDNPEVSGGLTKQGVVWVFTTAESGAWQPLVWLSLMADRDIFDRLPGWLHLTLPGWYHFTNVLLHAVASVLLFLVLRQMTGRLWPAALVAAVFALHPLRAESVAWVTERKDVLSGVCFMLLLGAYAAYARRKFSLLRYAAVVILLALGLMAKPVLVTAPCVLLLLDFWPLGRLAGGKNLGRLVLEKIPLFALAGVSCRIAVWAQGDALVSSAFTPWSWRIGNAILSYVGYLRDFFYPVHLAVAYPRRDVPLPTWQVLAAAALLAGVTAAAVAAGRKYPYGIVGWFWYLGMMAPVIGFLQFGVQAEADRFTYLPQIGIGIALAWAAADATRRVGTVPIFVAGHHAKRGRHENGTVPLARPKWPQTAVCGLGSAAVLIALAACAWRQTSYWRDDETLWTRALDCNWENAVAHDRLGVTLAAQGRTGEAIVHFHKAVEIKPDYADAHGNLGVALGNLKRIDEAVAEFQTALRINGNYADAHGNLGLALAARGQVDDAIAEYRQALKIKPHYAAAHANLGAALASLGRLDEAAAEYRESLKIHPRDAAVLSNLGGALADRGRMEEAIAAYREALAIQPEDPELLGTLAAAYAAAGRSAEAVQTAQRALRLALAAGRRPLADQIRARVELYRRGKPDRQPARAKDEG